ncbi:uncharacterized protein LOC129946433 isoform X2 [Eupeodes corollae]|uniref:uncharacterized protein LOC129946433 isoform X2 n=1 Tax=Eupeodes corollae TaxID=290404 RepID=UPI0024921723|nr:uncharacterized protein LOC129946433 isoform X2 [Eupeodes corollae]
MDKECFLCKSKEKDEVKFGEFMTCGKISVHYFCLLLSSNLMQNGEDNEGLLGFLPKDIQEEAHRVKPLICCYCRKPSANISCCASKCYKSFHLTCGDKNSTEHNFVGTFKSFCHRHVKGKKVTPPLPDEKCCICYDNILTPGTRFDTVNMIRAPCCKNGWFHKYCLASFAKTAGYFFKCPLCNDSKVFRQRLAYKSIFIPDRDAAWELVPNAFAELLERPSSCVAVNCYAEGGRKSQTKRNEFLFCSTCGSVAIHRRCMTIRLENFYCDECVSITAAIESSSVVNITPTKLNNNENKDEEEEDDNIDVGNDFDVSSENNSLNQIYCEEESADKCVKSLCIAKKRYLPSETESDSDSNVKDADFDSDSIGIKPLEIFKSNKYKIVDNDSFFNESDDDIASSRKMFSKELSNKKTGSSTFNGYKSTYKESFFDVGENFESSVHKCNSSSSFDSTISESWGKAELRVLVHVKKLISLDIEKRVNRRFISLSNDKKETSMVRSKRSLSQQMETFSDLTEKEDVENKKEELNTEIFDEEKKYSLSMFPGNTSCSKDTNNTSSKSSSETRIIISDPNFINRTSQISPLRLRSLSEDTSKRSTRIVERRRSVLQGFSSSTPVQQVTQIKSFKRPTETLESTSIKRSRLNSDTNKEGCTLNQEHSININVNYEDENKLDRLQSTGLMRRRSRGRSPLGVNLCDVYAYSTLPFVKKITSQNVDKTVVSENSDGMEQNLSDVEQIFSKKNCILFTDKPNIPQSTLKVKENTTKDSIITNKSITTTDTDCNIFEIFVATDKWKQQKIKMKRTASQKSTKGIFILPSNQTKIESFFKRI